MAMRALLKNYRNGNAKKKNCWKLKTMLMIMRKRDNSNLRNPPGRKNASGRTNVARRHHHLINYFQI